MHILLYAAVYFIIEVYYYCRMTNSHFQSAHLEYSINRLLDVSVVSISICSFCDCQTKRLNLLLCVFASYFAFKLISLIESWIIIIYCSRRFVSVVYLWIQCPHSLTQTVCVCALYLSYGCTFVAIFGLFSTQSCNIFSIFHHFPYILCDMFLRQNENNVQCREHSKHTALDVGTRKWARWHRVAFHCLRMTSHLSSFHNRLPIYCYWLIFFCDSILFYSIGHCVSFWH